MRLPIIEIIDGYERLDREVQLNELGEKLQTQLFSDHESDRQDRLALPMRLAVQVLVGISSSNSSSSSVLLDDAFNVESVLAFQVALGGSSGGVPSSRLFTGALLPIEYDHCTRIHHAFQATMSANGGETKIIVSGGIVTINGDFGLPTLSAIENVMCGGTSIQLVFCYGEINSQTQDWCWRSFSNGDHQRIKCIAVDSYKNLTRIADLTGAQIVDSWLEILPEAIGNESIELRLVEISSPRLVGGFNDDYDMNDGDFRGLRTHSKLFLNVVRSEQNSYLEKQHQHHSSPLRTLLVRSSTYSEAHEFQQQVQKSLRRVVNALRCGHLLPSSGSFLCACAAELRLAITLHNDPLSSSESEAEVIVLEQVVDALSKLTVTLLQNTGQGFSSDSSPSSDFFTLYAWVRAIQANYIRGFQDDCADAEHSRFYARCHFGGTDFCALAGSSLFDTKLKTSRFDDFSSVRSAFRKSFRLVDLALSVGTYHVNGSAV